MENNVLPVYQVGLVVLEVQQVPVLLEFLKLHPYRQDPEHKNTQPARFIDIPCCCCMLLKLKRPSFSNYDYFTPVNGHNLGVRVGSKTQRYS